jgi:hypothetical protein
LIKSHSAKGSAVANYIISDYDGTRMQINPTAGIATDSAIAYERAVLIAVNSLPGIIENSIPIYSYA